MLHVNFLSRSILLVALLLNGCSTTTATSPAVAPLTLSANELFTGEVGELNDYLYAQGQALGR